MPYGSGVGLLLIRSWVLGNEAHENRNGVLLFLYMITSNHMNNSKRQSINGKEFDTHRVGVEKNSCSTMHKIAAKEFTLDDFSHEHLGVIVPAELNDGIEVFQNLWIESLKRTIEDLNIARCSYIREKNSDLKKKYWWQMIQLLPSSYNQKRTVMLNYEVLANIYKSRRNHKLDEWRTFCDWIERLPYSELITGK